MVFVLVAGKTVEGPGKSSGVYFRQNSRNPAVHFGGREAGHIGGVPLQEMSNHKENYTYLGLPVQRRLAG